MTRPIQPGDFVLISTEGYAEYFKIISVVSTEIRMSPSNEPDKISMLVPSPTGEWKVYGTDTIFEFKFITRDQYIEIQTKSSSLLALPDDIILELGLGMEVEDINRLCRTNNRFNNIICANQIFWEAKYRHDFGEPSTTPSDWKLEYAAHRSTMMHDQVAKNPIYGIQVGGGPLKIVNNLYLPEDAPERLKKRGKSCTAMPKGELVKILQFFEIYPPDHPPENRLIPIGVSRDEMLGRLEHRISRYVDVKSITDDQLFFYYIWYEKPKEYTKEYICDTLKDFFYKNHLLIKR